MADINFETERLAELMAEVNRQMREYGEVTKHTQDQLFNARMSEKYGIKDATTALKSAGEAAGNLAKAAGAAGAAMYNNKKGSAAFNSSLDAVSSAATAAATGLLALGGPVGMVAAGLMLLVGAGAKAVKVINEQSDAVYKGFQDLSRSGGAASDGMTGLFADVQKLGLGFQDLEGYTRLIADSSKELALFGGSVIKGRKQFADMGAAMAPFRESLFNAGMTQEEINEASMGYLRLQSRIGQTQNKTATELADGARRYLIEQDALTKLTGMTRKEQEDAREEARSQERFAAVLAEMRAKGQFKQAKELEDTYLILRSQNKLAGQGLLDVTTGLLTTEAAQKGFFATQGENMRIADQLKAGQINATEAVQRYTTAVGRTVDAMNPLAQMGMYGEFIGDYAGDLRLKAMKDADIAAQLAKIQEDQIKQGVKGAAATDAAQQQQTALRIEQQNSMLALQDLVNDAVMPTTSLMQEFGRAVERATLTLIELVNWLPSFGPNTEEVRKAKSDVSAREREVLDLEWKVANARSEHDKELAIAELKVAKSRQLDAEVARKYAQDRATGRTGAGMGGQQLRADGSIIESYDADYEAPRPLTGMGGTGKETLKSIQAKGLKTKEGDVQKENAAVSPKLLDIAKKIQDSLGNFGYFTGFNDEYHHTLGYASKHTEGLALDFKLDRRPTPEQGKEIVSAIKSMGASKVLDEYNNPSPSSTGPHIHVEIPEFADGGIASGPKSGYPAMLHGTEAVIPLKNGAVPVSIDMKNALGTKFFKDNDSSQNSKDNLEAIKQITDKLGLYDNATKIITDPTTWKQILNSGVSPNYYDIGMADISSKMLPEISTVIGDRIQDLKNTNSQDTTATIRQMANEFKAVLVDTVRSMGGNDSPAAAGQLAALQQLIQEQRTSNSIQEKLLRAAAS